MIEKNDKITRIAVFYDGNYFLHVSNYYYYEHARQSRINISGLHDFIRYQVAKEENIDPKFCHVVDAHYFRGRLNAYEARELGKLYSDRQFDDILMSEGVVTHYLPLKSRYGKKEEKGIDVWLALEAFELSILKKFNVVALIASDGDYVPLVRKLNTLGTRVMLLSWDFEFNDQDVSKTYQTRTSQDLLEEVTYPIPMHEIIDNRITRNEPIINNLFVPRDIRDHIPASQRKPSIPLDAEARQSYIVSLSRNGFGFIAAQPNNLYFHSTDLTTGNFNDLNDGDLVEFMLGKNEKGECARNVKYLNIPNINEKANYQSNLENNHYQQNKPIIYSNDDLTL